MIFVYLLQSQKNGRTYVGQTDHIIRRFQQHNSGLNPSTKAHLPWLMIWWWSFSDRVEAVRFEHNLKHSKSKATLRRWLKNICSGAEDLLQCPIYKQLH